MAFSSTQAQTALVDRVLVKMDALDAPGQSITAEQAEVYYALEEAARQILETVPIRLLFSLMQDGKTAINAEMAANTSLDIKATNAFVPLPAAFVRLVEMALAGWKMSREHRDVLEDSVETYRRYLRGETGTTSEPVLFLTHYVTSTSWAGKQAIHAFPGTGEESTPVSTFLYIAETAPESMPSKLTEPLLWLAASILLQSFDPELAGLAEGRYLQAIGTRTKKHANVQTRHVRPMGL